MQLVPILWTSSFVRTAQETSSSRQRRQSNTLGKMPWTHIAAAGSCSRAFRLLRPMLSDSSYGVAHSGR